MDLETENRIAAILMKEAAELRRQAEKEGVHAYLRKPNVRGRPNSRFLTATVLGVQQANRSVEVNEMWRVRQKELELDNRLKGRSGEEGSSRRRDRDVSNSLRSSSKRCVVTDKDASALCSSSKRVYEDCSREDELKDEDIEEFLHARMKRGRGAVGSRMDETGPYLPQDSPEDSSTSRYVREERVRRVLGPEKPPHFLKSHESDEDMAKKARSGISKNKHKHGSKEKSKDKKKKKEEKRYKYQV